MLKRLLWIAVALCALIGVSAIHKNHLEVKATDGKTARMMITEKTRVVRPKTAIKSSDNRAAIVSS